MLSAAHARYGLAKDMRQGFQPATSIASEDPRAFALGWYETGLWPVCYFGTALFEFALKIRVRCSGVVALRAFEIGS